jgi:hypothetical protein
MQHFYVGDASQLCLMSMRIIGGIEALSILLQVDFMDGTLFLMILVMTAVGLIIQRTEEKKRRGVLIVMGIFMLGVLYFVSLRDFWGGLVLSIVIAGVINLVYWMLVGRYNPVGTSDSIKVLGMDD